MLFIALVAGIIVYFKTGNPDILLITLGAFAFIVGTWLVQSLLIRLVAWASSRKETEDHKR